MSRVLALLVVGVVCVTLTACGHSRTEGMTCEQLKQDNLTMTSTMTRAYDLDRVRENNAALTDKGCW